MGMINEDIFGERDILNFKIVEIYCYLIIFILNIYFF